MCLSSNNINHQYILQASLSNKIRIRRLIVHLNCSNLIIRCLSSTQCTTVKRNLSDKRYDTINIKGPNHDYFRTTTTNDASFIINCVREEDGNHIIIIEIEEEKKKIQKTILLCKGCVTNFK